MSTDPIYLLPPPNSNRAPREPVTHLLEVLDYIAKTFRVVVQDADRHKPLFYTADERREQLYYAAAALLANTYPEDEQSAVYERHTTRYSSLNAIQQRVAALAMYGLATDFASSVRPRDGHTWAAAAIAAIETYRNRPTTRISDRSA